ncbi:MAG: hypothetical protein WBE13_03625 [Candidatus Acidiferrum sp.]
MKYAKPEVTLINSATAEIQTSMPKNGTQTDGTTGTFHYLTVNAYEADE